MAMETDHLRMAKRRFLEGYVSTGSKEDDRHRNPLRN